MPHPLLSQIPGAPLQGLAAADRLWQTYRMGDIPIPQVVTTAPERLPTPDFDVVICGGTLGILLGATLAKSGWRVALLERGTLRGRDQEWNISRQELQTFVELGVLSEIELETAIVTEYNPARIRFSGGQAVWVNNVLNIGVDPVYLLEQLKQVFLAAGGQLYEKTAFQAAVVHPNGVAVTAGEQRLTSRLLIDAMGHFSPMAQQARQGERPDSVCLVVGTCAEGYPDNKTGDLLVSFSPIRNQCQYFWEAFPARDGRTTYLFTYLDTHPSRPSLSDLFDDYFALLPDYQNISLEQLFFKRALFGFFPAYRRSPLRYPWGHTLAVGDSSGNQSPLSFGGFGAMVRHLDRLSQGIEDALRQDLLSASALGWLHPYQPNLSVTWLFQKAMSVGVNQTLSPDHINALLSTIFADMAALGDDVLRPFLQDVVQFGPLAKTLLRTSIYHPALVAKILPQVGVSAIADWSGHYGGLATYSLLNRLVGSAPLKALPQALSVTQRYYYQRWQEALQYGSGGDHP
ncbi:MAG: FAD-binding oxidoreductase [Cyanobacteria bacterium P01_D01_bin.44]